VSCSIGATLGNGGWSTLLNGAKDALMINGQPPIAPPDIPEDRLNLPPIPVIEPQMPDTSSQYTGGSQSTDQGQQVQHMPGQHSTGTTGTTGTSAAPTPSPPPGGNTFLDGPPPPPGAPQDGPPPPDGVPPLGLGAPPGPAAPPPDAGPALGPPPGEPLPPPPPPLPLPGQ
jgi:hypothetical protein